MNKVILTGRIANDLVLRQTPSGVSACSFNLAVEIPGKKDQADFIAISTWEQRAEFVTRYLGKGRKIVVEGYLRTRTYADKNGVNHKITEVVATNIEFADSRPQGPFAEPEQQAQQYDQSGYYGGQQG